MAHTLTDDKKPEGQPDGAPPGAEARSPQDRFGFDADGRAAAREGATITIGSEDFHRRRKNWDTTRALRALLRQQERAATKASRLRARVEALTEEIRGVRDYDSGGWVTPPVTDDDRIEQIEAQVDDLEEQQEKAQDDSDEAAYGIIALLLRNPAGAQPDTAHLKEHLDVEEAGDLAALLAGGGEVDPTPTTETSSST